MQVICLEEEAFFALVEQVVARLKEKHGEEKDINKNKWVDDVEAMKLLNIKSKTTLQALRDEREIRFSQHKPRVILYDRDSINEYLEKHARETSKRR